MNGSPRETLVFPIQHMLVERSGNERKSPGYKIAKTRDA